MERTMKISIRKLIEIFFFYWMHSIFNSLSAFANEAAITAQRSIIKALFIIIVSGGYALYIVLKVKDTEVK